MTRSKRLSRGFGKLAKGSAVGIAGVVLLFGAAWAGPPNPTPSDGLGNTAGGAFALSHNNTGLYNTAFGQGALYSNTAGAYNTAIGLNALIENTGEANTASGFEALFSNTTGGANTATGFEALYSNTTGGVNTASGFQALYGNTEGGGNTASGTYALRSNTRGDNNTASGSNALYNNTEGIENTANGAGALFSNTTASYNTASGFSALYSNTTGGLLNTASGFQALYSNTTGGGNTAVAGFAGRSNTTGSTNTFIGYNADANAGGYSNGTALGSEARLTASNSIVLGDNNISKIYANVTTITGLSDRRRKKDIRVLDADLGLDFIEKLKPVSYRFNNGDETERYGFIAQDLEEALPASLHDTIERSEPEHGLALIERQNDADRTYRVSYGELLAPIVKSIQQQQHEITALHSQLAALKGENDGLRHSLAALRKQVIAAR